MVLGEKYIYKKPVFRRYGAQGLSWLSVIFMAHIKEFLSCRKICCNSRQKQTAAFFLLNDIIVPSKTVAVCLHL